MSDNTTDTAPSAAALEAALAFTREWYSLDHFKIKATHDEYTHRIARVIDKQRAEAVAAERARIVAALNSINWFQTATGANGGEATDESKPYARMSDVLAIVRGEGES